MEWRHSTGVDDTDVSPSEGGGVRSEKESDESDEEKGRQTAEEASSSENEEVDVEEMAT